MVIPFYEITAYQHYNCYSDVCSDVALPSHDIYLMHCNITCLSGFFCLVWTVCSISLTDNCITIRVALLLYYWRVRLFRFFLVGELDCYWVTAGGESNCGDGVDDLTTSGVDGVDENNVDLNTAILLFILFFMTLISSLKLSIIACRALSWLVF